MPAETASFIDHDAILRTLDSGPADPGAVRDILAKAKTLVGLTPAEAARLTRVDDPELKAEMFETARAVKLAIYGRRLVLFAPLYISNLCANECLYCAFRAGNRELKRRRLTIAEITEQTALLARQGHKRLLLVAGESGAGRDLDYVVEAIGAIQAVHEGHGEIRRVNVNLAPLDEDGFARIKAAGIGTYQLFQETYHRETYARVHVRGKKRDYDWRTTALDRAMRSGIDDVGMGVLLGLADWRYDLAAMLFHIAHLEDVFGVGCHTVSVPRMEPAEGSAMASSPPSPVGDDDFKKIVAILRLAVPYTGIILSTRESAAIRRESLALGVSQMSAGSRTDPGGYSGDQTSGAQFELGDHRPLDEVVRDATELDQIPSFCTACYRLGRTGRDFMDMAKPGLIKNHCDPNALTTLEEYLLDFASPETARTGHQAIEAQLNAMEPRARDRARAMLDAVRLGERDVYR